MVIAVHTCHIPSHQIPSYRIANTGSSASSTSSVATADHDIFGNPLREFPESVDSPAHPDPFMGRYGKPLPRLLAEEAHGMTWREFYSTFAPQPDIRLTHLQSEKLRAGLFRFSAQVGGVAREITATGPASAITHLLADAGRHVEMLNFHQHTIFEATVTFVRGRSRRRTVWAMGYGPSPEDSIAAALSSAAFRLYQ